METNPKGIGKNCRVGGRWQRQPRSTGSSDFDLESLRLIFLHQQNKESGPECLRSSRRDSRVVNPQLTINQTFCGTGRESTDSAEKTKVGNDKILSQLKPAVFIYRIGALRSATGPFKEAPLSGKCRHLLTAGSGAFPSTAAARLIIYLQPPSVLSSLWSHAVNITLFIKY